MKNDPIEVLTLWKVFLTQYDCGNYYILKVSVVNLFFQDNPLTPILPWRLPAEKILWQARERVRGIIPFHPHLYPPSSKGEDNTCKFSWFESDESIMTHYLPNPTPGGPSIQWFAFRGGEKLAKSFATSSFITFPILFLGSSSKKRTSLGHFQSKR
jgi:hypothetical protein